MQYRTYAIILQTQTHTNTPFTMVKRYAYIAAAVLLLCCLCYLVGGSKSLNIFAAGTFFNMVAAILLALGYYKLFPKT